MKGKNSPKWENLSGLSTMFTQKEIYMRKSHVTWLREFITSVLKNMQEIQIKSKTFLRKKFLQSDSA